MLGPRHLSDCARLATRRGPNGHGRLVFHALPGRMGNGRGHDIARALPQVIGRALPSVSLTVSVILSQAAGHQAKGKYEQAQAPHPGT